MKILYIIIGIVLFAFVFTQIYVTREQKNIESYTYTVQKKYETFEIRSYDASLFTSVTISTNDFENASSKGFSILAGYIFGKNDRNEKIAMTSPVTMSLEDSMTVMFMVPKKLKKETLPKPIQSQIEFREEPPKMVAAISFGGWANAEKIKKYKEKLCTALEANNVKYTNRFYFLGYNPPFEVFNRKNEIIVELQVEHLN